MTCLPTNPPCCCPRSCVGSPTRPSRRSCYVAAAADSIRPQPAPLSRVATSRQVGRHRQLSVRQPEPDLGRRRHVFDSGEIVAKRVTAASRPDPYDGPEVHVCSYLDSAYPDLAPHFLYAYYARAFSVPLLRQLDEQLILAHAVDAIVIVDGGSDSLMAGDEEGLGDPIEDAVWVATVASPDPRLVKILLSVGLGTDRDNDVSDAASLRAIAELTRLGGFLGAASLEPSGPCCRFYRDCLEHIYRVEVLLGSLGDDCLGHRGLVRPGRGPPAGRRPGERGELFLWPLMAVLWAFDVDRVARRSHIARWIVDCPTVSECTDAFLAARDRARAAIRDVENFPRHEDMRA